MDSSTSTNQTSPIEHNALDAAARSGRLVGRQWLTFGLSFTLHAAMLAVLLLMVRNFAGGADGQEPVRDVGIVLTLRDASQDQQQYLESTQVQPDSPSAENSVPSSSSIDQEAPPQLAETSSVAELALPGIQFDRNNDAAKMAVAPSSNQSIRAYELTDADKKLIAADRKYFNSLKPAGPTTSLSVFGSGQLEGRSFLFLLDRSKSMGSGGLDVLTIAGQQLSAAIDRLEPHHRFQVVGYNTGTTPLNEARLLPATPENKAAVPKFIRDMVAFGATAHELGLITASAYRSDIIVLLSDGDDFGKMTDSRLKKIKRLMDGQTQVHCIQFGLGPAKANTGFMKKLAAQNRGTFRYIDINQWRQANRAP